MFNFYFLMFCASSMGAKPQTAPLLVPRYGECNAVRTTRHALIDSARRVPLVDDAAVPTLASLRSVAPASKRTVDDAELQLFRTIVFGASIIYYINTHIATS